MNVVLFAWCPSAIHYVDALSRPDLLDDHGAHLRLVATGPHGSAALRLAPACEQAGAPLERIEDVNDPDFVRRIEAAGTDLILVAGCSQVLRPALRKAAALGAVNLHPSLLPSYRGKEPLFWALVRGERAVGVTAHVMTDDLDSGPILAQIEVPVPPRATSASLAEDVDRAGADLLPSILQAARRFADPTCPRSAEPPPAPSPVPAASYFPPLSPEHGLLDWSRSAIELDRLVRACEGEIHAYSYVGGMKVILLEAEPSTVLLAPCVERPPGTILAAERGALLIVTADGVLTAQSWLFLDRRLRSDELAALLDIRPGSRFASNPAFS